MTRKRRRAPGAVVAAAVGVEATRIKTARRPRLIAEMKTSTIATARSRVAARAPCHAIADAAIGRAKTSAVVAIEIGRAMSARFVRNVTATVNRVGPASRCAIVIPVGLASRCATVSRGVTASPCATANRGSTAIETAIGNRDATANRASIVIAQRANRFATENRDVIANRNAIANRSATGSRCAIAHARKTIETSVHAGANRVSMARSNHYTGVRSMSTRLNDRLPSRRAKSGRYHHAGMRRHAVETIATIAVRAAKKAAGPLRGRATIVMKHPSRVERRLHSTMKKTSTSSSMLERRSFSTSRQSRPIASHRAAGESRARVTKIASVERASNASSAPNGANAPDGANAPSAASALDVATVVTGRIARVAIVMATADRGVADETAEVRQSRAFRDR